MQLIKLELQKAVILKLYDALTALNDKTYENTIPGLSQQTLSIDVGDLLEQAKEVVDAESVHSLI